MREKTEDALLNQAMQQGFRAEADTPPNEVVEAWLDLMKPPVDSGRGDECKHYLRQIYVDYLQSVRIWHGQTRRKADKYGRTGNKRESRKLSTDVADELANFTDAIDTLIEIAGKLGPASQTLLTQALAEHSGRSEFMRKGGETFRERWNQVYGQLIPLTTAAERSGIEKKKGRDEAALRSMIWALANVWQEFTGYPPRRSYDGARAAKSDQSGEKGLFLKLARAMTTCADETLEKEGLRAGSRSLSKIVREVLKEANE